MRRLLPHASLCLALLALAACGDSSDDGADRPAPFPAGSIRVNWTLTDLDGAPLSCDDARITDVIVLVAGLEANVGLDGGAPAPTPIDCELGIAIFDDVPEGRYPVRVRLMRSDMIVDETAQNVDVTGDEEAVADFTFELDRTQTGARGGLNVRWTIDGRPASEACADYAATTVNVATDVSSIDQFDVNAACTDGSVIVDNLLAGRYSLRLRLLDSTGATTPSAPGAGKRRSRNWRAARGSLHRSSRGACGIWRRRRGRRWGCRRGARHGNPAGGCIAFPPTEAGSSA